MNSDFELALPLIGPGSLSAIMSGPFYGNQAKSSEFAPAGI